jgi:hypothetical protein
MCANPMVAETKSIRLLTFWSRTKSLNPINTYSGRAYGLRNTISPLSVVRNLYLN